MIWGSRSGKACAFGNRERTAEKYIAIASSRRGKESAVHLAGATAAAASPHRCGGIAEIHGGHEDLAGLELLRGRRAQASAVVHRLESMERTGSSSSSLSPARWQRLLPPPLYHTAAEIPWQSICTSKTIVLSRFVLLIDDLCRLISDLFLQSTICAD